MAIIINKESNILDVYRKKGIKHKVLIGTNTIEIIKDGDRKEDNFIMLNSKLSLSTLSFIKAVKRDSELCGRKEVNISSSDIFYYKFNHSNLIDGIYSDITEIDVNGAYWEIARQKGYISEDTYTRGLTVPKFDRLIGLGSLATKKSIHYFDGKNYHFEGYKSNERTRSFFFDISKHLDSMMIECFNEVGAEFIYFFWVDAIFCSNIIKGRVIEFFKKNGLGVKEKKIYSATLKSINQDKKIYLFMEEENELKESQTNFYIKKFSSNTGKSEFKENIFKKMYIGR